MLNLGNVLVNGIYIVKNGHAVTCENSYDDEFGEINPIIPGNREQEMTLNLNDDFVNRVEFKENKHLNDLNHIDIRPIHINDI